MAKNIYGNNFSSVFQNNKARLFGLGDISISKNLEQRNTIQRKKYIKNCKTNTINIVGEESKITPNLNPCKLTNFALYCSAVELFSSSMRDIINRFPASICVTDTVSGQKGSSIESYLYDNQNDVSIISISPIFFKNPFDVKYTININEGDRHIDLDYVLWFKGTEYSIIDIKLADDTTCNIQIKVNGDPFSFYDNVDIFYIKPSENKFLEFENSLTLFQKNILNSKTNPKYIFCVEDIIETDTGIINKIRRFVFPMVDDFNIDVTSLRYSDYFNNLLKIANKYDNNGTTNNLLGNLVPSIIWKTEIIQGCDGEFEIDGTKMKVLLNTYACAYDRLYSYIKGIQFSNVLNYTDYDTAPNGSLDQLSYKLGWKGLAINTNQFWKNIILNSSWIFSKKGTLQGINFLFDILGIPKELIKIEHSNYKAYPIDVNYIKYLLTTYESTYSFEDLLIDEDGFPDFKGQQVDISQLECIIPDFNNININREVSFINEQKIISYDLSGDTVYECTNHYYNQNLSALTCYDITDNIIQNPVIEQMEDACGCSYETVQENIKQINIKPIELYSGQCNTIVLNPHYDCLDNGYAKLNINVLGGTAPYKYYGVSDGDIVQHGDLLEFYVIDSNGCSSNVYMTPVICPITCDLSVELFIDCCTEVIIDECDCPDCPDIIGECFYYFVRECDDYGANGSLNDRVIKAYLPLSDPDTILIPRFVGDTNAWYNVYNNATETDYINNAGDDPSQEIIDSVVSIKQGCNGMTIEQRDNPKYIEDVTCQCDCEDKEICINKLRIVIEGGSGAYDIQGGFDGMVVTSGETYVITVTDSNGCQTTKQITENCSSEQSITKLINSRVNTCINNVEPSSSGFTYNVDVKHYFDFPQSNNCKCNITSLDVEIIDSNVGFSGSTITLNETQEIIQSFNFTSSIKQEITLGINYNIVCEDKNFIGYIEHIVPVTENNISNKELTIINN